MAKHLEDTRLVLHNPQTGRTETICHTVAVAESLFSKIMGRMFTQSIDESYALIFPFEYERRASLHMLFVPYDLGAVWLSENEIEQATVMEGWFGTSKGQGTSIIELHPKHIEKMDANSQLYLEGSHGEKYQLTKPETVSNTPFYLD